MERDLRELAEGLIEGLSSAEQRKLVELFVLIALNAKNLRAACQAFREDYAVGSIGQSTCPPRHPDSQRAFAGLSFIS